MIKIQDTDITFIAKISCLLFILALGFLKQKVDIQFSAQKNSPKQIVSKVNHKTVQSSLVKSVNYN